MENYSLRIENLLCELSPEMKGMRVIITQNPYREIYNVLSGRVSTLELEKFQKSYQGIDGVSISELQSEGYNIEMLITDLIRIVETVKEKIK